MIFGRKESLEEAGFSRVRVADQCNDRKTGRGTPLARAVAVVLHVLDLLPQQRRALDESFAIDVGRQPPLRLRRAELLVSQPARHRGPRHAVQRRRQRGLQTALARSRALREERQHDGRSVRDANLLRLLAAAPPFSLRLELVEGRVHFQRLPRHGLLLLRQPRLPLAVERSFETSLLQRREFVAEHKEHFLQVRRHVPQVLQRGRRDERLVSLRGVARPRSDDAVDDRKPRRRR
mmetsp:Transcript_21534/g.66410  ORF Transcript_21534/g.66410 Transcript_21534/m.66410 type:complete len:235 (-) Transcript_21534:297-1001(-)